MAEPSGRRRFPPLPPMLSIRSTRALPLTAALLVLAAVPGRAQVADTAAKPPAGAPSTGTPPAGTPPAQGTAPASPRVTVSGNVFGSYSFQPSTTEAQQPGQVDNAFVVDRAYLNFRATAGDRATVRVTADVYQTTEATANAYTFRAKYAYLQYDGPRSASGAGIAGRIGIIQNVLIESQEGFWPRFLAQTAVERAGYFSSADAGFGTVVTLPRRFGEVYGTIVNGPGYAARERDRFKDFALRVSLTPLAGDSAVPSLLRSLTLSAWSYRGALASKFVNGGPAQVGNVGAALGRSRAGVFLGLRDPRLVIVAEHARRRDESEQGSNTLLAPRTVGATRGHLTSGYVVLRPLAFRDTASRSFGLVARYDRVSPTVSSENLVPAPETANSYHNLVAGALWDLTTRAQIALDYQESLATSDGTSSAPPAPMKGYFLHFNVTF